MDQMARQLLGVITASDQYRRVMAHAVGVGVQDAAALAELLRSGALAPSVLGKRLRLASASVTGILDRLEAAGLIQRERHPIDRRSVLIVLTHDGRAVSRAMFDMFADDVERAVRDARADHVDEHTAVLRDIAAALGERAGEPDQIGAELRRRVARKGFDNGTLAPLNQS